jgi:glycerophosphoryl diester phosphodiesterase
VSSIELDIAISADHVPVVLHDPLLNPDLARDASGAWLEPPCPAVNRLTLADLRRLDVGRARPGSAIARAFPDQKPSDGARIPTLAEVFDVTAGSGVWIEAELKTDPRTPCLTAAPSLMADLVVAAARTAGALGRLRVRSFDWRGLRHLSATCPGVPLGWLTDAGTEAAPAVWWGGGTAASTPHAVAAAAGHRAAPPVWAPDYTGLTAALVAEAHASGLRVVPWTVNTPADMVRLIGWGVDGLCTDRPDLARAALGRL